MGSVMTKLYGKISSILLIIGGNTVLQAAETSHSFADRKDRLLTAVIALLTAVQQYAVAPRFYRKRSFLKILNRRNTDGI